MTKGLRPQDWVGAQVLPPTTCVTLNRLSQLRSVAQSCPTLCDPLDWSFLSMANFLVHHQLPELAQTHIHWVSDAIQPSHPLSSPSPPTFNLSQHQGLYSESVLRIRWSKYWSFSFSISPSNEYSGLISFKIDWLDLHAVQRTLRSLSNTTDTFPLWKR